MFLAGNVGLLPLAVLGRMPEDIALADALAAVARRIVERLTKEASHDRAAKLLARTLLLAGLRVQRDVAFKIFEGVHMLEESDTYLAILEEGEEKARREAVAEVGEERLGPCDESVRNALANVSDLARLKRMVRRAAKANSWQEIIETL